MPVGVRQKASSASSGAEVGAAMAPTVLTLPEEIRRALHISEGDEVEFAVHDDGTITVRGYVSIPTDQAWFFTPEWLAGEREADEDIAGRPGNCARVCRGHVRPPGRRCAADA